MADSIFTALAESINETVAHANSALELHCTKAAQLRLPAALLASIHQPENPELTELLNRVDELTAQLKLQDSEDVLKDKKTMAKLFRAVDQLEEKMDEIEEGINNNTTKGLTKKRVVHATNLKLSMANDYLNKIFVHLRRLDRHAGAVGEPANPNEVEKLFADFSRLKSSVSAVESKSAVSPRASEALQTLEKTLKAFEDEFGPIPKNNTS